MSDDRRQLEIDQNFDFFQSQIRNLFEEHRGKYALLRDQRIIGFFARVEDAARAAEQQFADGIFSIQVVEPEPVDLGFFSRA